MSTQIYSLETLSEHGMKKLHNVMYVRKNNVYSYLDVYQY